MSELISSLENINRADLQDFVYLLFIFITVNCDDYGRIDGNPRVVKAKTYPTSSRNIDDFKLAIDMLEGNNLIEYYEANGNTYIQVIGFMDKQGYKKGKKLKHICPKRDGDPIKYGVNEAEMAQDTIPYQEILGHLNTSIGASEKESFKHTSWQHRFFIKSRWNDGFRVDDFKKVIDNSIIKWAGTDFAKYIRPQTLFKTKERFQEYMIPVQKVGGTTKQFAQMQPSDSANAAWERALQIVKSYGKAGYLHGDNDTDKNIFSTIKDICGTWANFCEANKYILESIKRRFLTSWR